MATFCYELEGEIIERIFSVGEAPQEITVNGKTARRCYQAELSGVRRRLDHDLCSEALAVKPAEAKKQMQEMKRMPGCPDHIDGLGRLHWTGVDAVQRRTAFERSRGLINTKHFG